MTLIFKNIKYLLLIFVIGILIPSLVGINNAGQRTVIQYPTGTLVVKFEPGIYLQWFGKTTSYYDVLTFDFDKTDATGEASLDQQGISVRHQDGGTGTIYGKALIVIACDQVVVCLRCAIIRDRWKKNRDQNNGQWTLTIHRVANDPTSPVFAHHYNKYVFDISLPHSIMFS